MREDASPVDLSSAFVTTYLSRPDPNAVYSGEQRRNVYHGNLQPIRYTHYLYLDIRQGEQTRTLKHDSLGRLAAETHPENGTLSYAYDNAGNLTQKTDARAVTATTSYDEINRPTQTTYSDGTPTATYTYDLGTYGIGRLRSISNADATSTYTYNIVGAVTQEQKTIGAQSFTLSRSLNLGGLETSVTLPNGTVISDSYDLVGRLTSVTSSWVDSQHPGTLASNLQYHPTGAIRHIDYGNGTRADGTYNSGGQLKTLQQGLAGSPGNFLNLVYNYDEGTANNGRIMSIDNLNDSTKNLSFTYDRFYRLATAQTAGTHWGLSWSYDRYGNRLSQTVTKGTAPSQSLTVSTATNRVSGWTYDAAGNVLNDTRHSYVYDAENRITSMDGGATQYRYDAQGSRVMKVTASETIYYTFGVGEYSSAVGWRKLYVSLGQEKLVEYSNGTTYFFHADHLATPKAQTNVSGTVVETWDNYPFGEQWVQSGSSGNQHRFTGKERDGESGNDYFGARYYVSTELLTSPLEVRSSEVCLQDGLASIRFGTTLPTLKT